MSAEVTVVVGAVLSLPNSRIIIKPEFSATRSAYAGPDRVRVQVDVSGGPAAELVVNLTDLEQALLAVKEARQ